MRANPMVDLHDYLCSLIICFKAFACRSTKRWRNLPPKRRQTSSGLSSSCRRLGEINIRRLIKEEDDDWTDEIDDHWDDNKNGDRDVDKGVHRDDHMVDDRDDDRNANRDDDRR